MKVLTLASIVVLAAGPGLACSGGGLRDSADVDEVQARTQSTHATVHEAGTGTFPVVERIEPLASLSADESRLVRDVLVEHPEVRRDALVVYRLDDGRGLVAPRSDAVSVGTPVVTSGWSAVLQRVTLGEDEVETLEVSVAGRIEPAEPGRD